jgi:hypothetical protein
MNLVENALMRGDKAIWCIPQMPSGVVIRMLTPSGVSRSDQGAEPIRLDDGLASLTSAGQTCSGVPAVYQAIPVTALPEMRARSGAWPVSMVRSGAIVVDLPANLVCVPRSSSDSRVSLRSRNFPLT